MSNTPDTAPAAETDFAETATSLTEALGGSERHQAQEIHETEREAGAAMAAQPAAPAATPAKTSAQPAPTAATPAPAPAGEATPTAAEEKQPKWYREHMAKVNRELAATRQENERLRSGRQPSPQAQPQPRSDQPAFPDPVDDPQGYHEAVMASVVRQQSEFQIRTTLNLSERFLVQQHGRETFEEVQAWLGTKDGLADWCVNQPDPWGAAYAQYQRERLAEEIGDDPNAWREAEKARIRAELEAEMSAGREERHTPARSMTPNRAPPPAPASTARNAGGLERDGRGKFTGPTPMSAALRR